MKTIPNMLKYVMQVYIQRNKEQLLLPTLSNIMSCHTSQAASFNQYFCIYMYVYSGRDEIQLKIFVK